MLATRRALVSLASILAALPAMLSCGSRSQLQDTSHTGGAGAGTSTGGATGGSGGTTATGGTGGTGGCPLSCSADLHDVIDCHGQAIAECPPNQGCFEGKCIDDACLAAKLSESSYGCDYWALKTDLIDLLPGACFAAVVANTWGSPVQVQVEYQGMSLPVQGFTRIPDGQGKNLQYSPYDPSTGIPPGQVALLFLSREPAGTLPDCPAPAAIAADTGVQGTGRGHAFHVTTDRPVVAYQILPYGGAQSAATAATLLLPVSVWDANYMAINAYRQSLLIPEAQPSLNLLAQEDDTEVTVLPRVDVLGGGGVDPAPAKQPVTYHLSRGEHVQITQPAELTGSPIQSNKPIGVWGGANCMEVPADKGTCDSAQQQLPPVRAMGSEYVAVRYRSRAPGGAEETPPWRIVGLADGTLLSFDPPQPAPSEIKLGEVIEFASAGPFTVKSQDEGHPFYLGAYMTGGVEFGGAGDPEWVNVVPPVQYLDSYVFFTDPTYSETELVVVRPRGEDGAGSDVVLDCAGTIGDWHPLGGYEWTRVDLVTGNFQSVNGCSNGRHDIRSNRPFGVTVWGWGSQGPNPPTSFVSYAYPAGARVAKVNDVAIPAN